MTVVLPLLVVCSVLAARSGLLLLLFLWGCCGVQVSPSLRHCLARMVGVKRFGVTVSRSVATRQFAKKGMT